MFDWFKKKKKFTRIKFYEEEQIDEMEKCLWEIKDEYDLPTEEIMNVVQSKRKNLDYMHKILAKKNK
jgi:esterase/lipase